MNIMNYAKTSGFLGYNPQFQPGQSSGYKAQVTTSGPDSPGLFGSLPNKNLVGLYARKYQVPTLNAQVGQNEFDEFSSVERRIEGLEEKDARAYLDDFFGRAAMAHQSLPKSTSHIDQTYKNPSPFDFNLY